MTDPDVAMVLAAGRGTRMRALAADRPKPLIEVAGRTLIDRVLDRVAAAGIGRAVVNLHHMADRIESHLAGRAAPAIAFSHEPALLETGGGVTAALPLLGTAPFLVHNADIVVLDGPTPSLARLARAWDDRRMDALLLLHPTARAMGWSGRGDYFAGACGRMRRRRAGEIAPYLFAGVQILHPRLFEGAPDGAFSLNLLYDRAEAAGRLFGLLHDGVWMHVGTPEGLRDAERSLRPPS